MTVAPPVIIARALGQWYAVRVGTLIRIAHDLPAALAGFAGGYSVQLLTLPTITWHVEAATVDQAHARVRACAEQLKHGSGAGTVLIQAREAHSMTDRTTFRFYRELLARRAEPAASCGHPIKVGDRIGWNAGLKRTRCADCWARWCEENREAADAERW